MYNDSVDVSWRTRVNYISLEYHDTLDVIVQPRSL